MSDDAGGVEAYDKFKLNRDERKLTFTKALIKENIFMSAIRIRRWKMVRHALISVMPRVA